MASVSLAREYRPQRFDEVHGQRHVTRTLQNAIRLGRTAQAYLFCGPRGVGKTTVARILAKALNCIHGPTAEPCGECDNCRRITAGSSLCVIEIDAASNRKIEDIRALREDVQFAPSDGAYKVYILDEVHQITKEGFEAFLKTLEEPPSHAVFILATTEAQKVPATILSRCQRFDFRRVPVEDIASRLRDVSAAAGFEVEEAAIYLIARAADGGLRDALSILDQIIAYSGAAVTATVVEEVLGTLPVDQRFALGEAFRQRAAAAALEWVSALLDAGRDPRTLIDEALAHVRLLLLARLGCAPEALRVLPAEQRDRLQAQADGFDPPRLMQITEILAGCDKSLKGHPQPRIVVEVALIEAAQGVTERLPAPAEALPPPAVAPPVHEAAPPRATPPAAPRATEASRRTSPPEPPAAPPAVAAASGPLDLALVQSVWAQVQATVRRDSVPLSAHLLRAVPHRVQGQTVVLGFDGWEASLSICLLPSQRDVIAGALSRALGRAVQVDGELVSAVATAAPPVADLAGAVQAALETFPGSRELDP
ncbi:MAG: DNA polymerase III subunit gamma/tau [Fimbriimonadaceae bacterium]|nr:DNA polymerase III subunit gamma/tau [Fimbriimonadaceae bacterium]